MILLIVLLFLIANIVVINDSLGLMTIITVGLNDITNIVIWKGSGFGVSNSDYTSTLAKKILSSLDIKDISMDSVDIIDFNDKVQCNICKQLSGTAKVLSHYYTCKYKSKIEINFVSFMDAVSI